MHQQIMSVEDFLIWMQTRWYGRIPNELYMRAQSNVFQYGSIERSILNEIRSYIGLGPSQIPKK